VDTNTSEEYIHVFHSNITRTAFLVRRHSAKSAKYRENCPRRLF